MEASTEVASENVELNKEERNRERKREFLTMEASTEVVSEKVELKKEEVKNKSNNNNNNKNKEAAPVTNGEVINAAAAAVTTNDLFSSDQEEEEQEQEQEQEEEQHSHSSLQHQETLHFLPQSCQVHNLSDLIAFGFVGSYIKQYNNIELSALGMAIPTVITIAEILKRDGLANNKEVKISTVDSKEDHRGSFIQKPKIQVILGKAETTTAADAATAPKTLGAKNNYQHYHPIPHWITTSILDEPHSQQTPLHKISSLSGLFPRSQCHCRIEFFAEVMAPELLTRRSSFITSLPILTLLLHIFLCMHCFAQPTRMNKQLYIYDYILNGDDGGWLKLCLDFTRLEYDHDLGSSLLTVSQIEKPLFEKANRTTADDTVFYCRDYLSRIFASFEPGYNQSTSLSFLFRLAPNMTKMP
ncbi:hypothetical protein Patl1_25221 [Pistacia atlantica]|uniref:Uncharacterized protein n=1 Tax=Pistacia atlantica TaxID=434234 RepID=A0ACC1AZT1_9ROSI|nr:hypothetical protein Patl1_25221 [Pistacia atlantica]